MQMHWYIMNVDTDARCAHSVENIYPVSLQTFAIQLHYVKMIGAIHVFFHMQRIYCGISGKGIIVLFSDFATTFQPFWMLAQLADSQGTLQVGQAVIVPQIYHFIKP